MSSVRKRAKSARKSVFFSYVVSYVSLVLLSCALLGILFFWFAVRDLRNTAIETTRAKMQAAVNDVQEQLLYCKDTALNISQDSAFRPAVFRQNKYYETELLNKLKLYRQSSVLSQDYFLVYHDSDIVYQSTGYINYFQPFSRLILGVGEDAELLSQINSIQTFTILAPEGSHQFLIAIPVYTNAPYDTHGRATLCYVVDRAAVDRRIQSITGGLGARYMLSQNGILLTSTLIEPQHDSFFMESLDGQLQLVLESSPDDLYAGLSLFGATAIGLFALLLALLVGYALFAAYRNYTPIKALASKYRQAEAPSIAAPENELKRIDKTLDDLVKKEELTTLQIQEQLYILREQLFRLVLGGHTSQRLQGRLQLLGIQLPGPYYCVFSCSWPEAQDRAEGKELQDLFSLIEALSETEILLYPCLEKNNVVLVLASLAEVSLAEEAADLLHSLLEAENHHVQIAAGQVCDSLEQIPVSYLSLRPGAQHQGQIPLVSDEAGEYTDPMDCIALSTERMLASSKEGNFDLAKEYLDEIISETKSTQQSMLVQRYIFNDVTTSMVRMGRKMELPLSERHIGTLLTVSDVDSFYQAALMVLVYWQENTKAPAKKAPGKDLSRVITYINENYLRYDLSLDSIADLFHLSPAQLSRDFKQGTGQTYRDYLIKLRVEKAKQLLVEENISVADTCQRIGYANISHFIKVFRRITGMTPAKYKESMWLSANREHMADMPPDYTHPC